MSDDHHLRDLIEQTALEELTPEQCAAIRAAAATSPEIRRACLDRIGLEERMASALGRPRVSVDDLLGGYQRVVESRLAGRWLAPLLILMLLAAATTAVIWLPPGRRGNEVAVAKPQPPAADAAVGDEAVDVPPSVADAHDETPHPGDAEQKPAADRPPPVATTALVAPTAVAAAAWEKALAVDGPEPTTADLFRLPDMQHGLTTPPDRGELDSWFAAVPGQPLKFGVQALNGRQSMASIEGVCRLVPPLRQGTALRLLLANPETLRIVAWSGRSGGVIEMDGPPTGWRWCGSVLSRREIGGAVESRWLASTSDGRGPRCGAAMDQGTIGFTGIVELRHCDGMLVLSRGEVRLVEVPLPEPPDEILFEGTLLVGGIELVRAVAPPPLPPPPPTTTEWRPTEVAWEGSGADALDKPSGGGVRLAQPAGKPQAPLLALWKVPPAAAGPREILMRIDDFTPGTGICIAGPDGKPVTVCGFVEPTAGGPPDRKGNLFMAWPPDKSPLTGGAPKLLGVAFAPRTVWLRFHTVSESSNVLVLSWSGDGKTWARLRQSPTLPPGPAGIGAVGLFVGGHPGRAITLTHLAVAELPGFAKILPHDLVAAVDPVLGVASDAKQLEPWKAAALKAAPADVDEGRWLAAAAIRCLATSRTRLSSSLCMLVWQHVRTLRLPLADQLAVCDDISRFLGGDEGPPGLTYGAVARANADADDLAAFRATWLRMQQAPADMVTARRFGQAVDPLAVPERMLRRLHVTGPTAELRAEAARQRFYANDRGFAAGLARQLDAASPVVFEIATPVQNAANDIADAVAAEAFDDAQRAMAAYTALGGEATGAVAQDPDDPERLATLPVLVSGLLEAQPAFRAFMQGQPAERGRLRLAQLRATGNAAGMAAATCEFQGTPAAAEAHEWLALRAVAAGDFAAARRQASAGLAAAAPDVRGRLASLVSIAAALGDGERGAPPQAAVAGIPPGEIAGIVAAAARPAATAASEMPPPTSGLEAVARLSLGPKNQGTPAVDYPESITYPSFQSPPFFRSRLDWAGEVCSLTAVAGRLLAGNRQEVVAVDPATGGEQWRLPAGPKPALLVRYGLVPMRPVGDARHAYLRRLLDNGSPTLAAVRLADGTIAWEVALPATRMFVSDPVIVDGLLQICELLPGVTDQLVLVTLDPDTGARRRERVVCGLLPSWRVARSGRTDPGDCQLVAAGGRLFLTLGGSVVCLTVDGHPVWVRRQPWMGPEGNRWWWFQAQAPPLAHEGALFVVQPGVDAVTAIDATTGRLRWRTPLVRVRRLIGLAGGGDAARLVVESDDGIVAIDPRDGAAQTILEARDGPDDGWPGVAPTRLLGPAVTTDDGRAIVAVHRRRPDTEKTGMLDLALLWIDCVSGEVRHAAVLPALADKPPWVGPMAVTDGRLWLLANPNPRDLRRVLWEFAPQPDP